MTTNDTTGGGGDDPKQGSSNKESDVYDRQIRLWGADAQAKMSKAKVLYVHVAGISSEVLKNMVLAGIRAVLCDSRPYDDHDVSATPSFFLAGAAASAATANSADNNNDEEEPPAKKKAKMDRRKTVAEVIAPVVEELNPLLGSCEIVPKSVPELDDEFVSQFPIVIASRIGISDAIRLSKAVVGKGGKFYVADSFGMYGASIFDLGADHAYRPEKGKELLDVTTLGTRHVSLETSLTKVPLSDATNRFHKTPPPTWILYRSILEYADQTGNWPTEAKADDFAEKVRAWITETSPSMLGHEVLTETSLRGLAKLATCEVAPVCSVLGGVIGNEIIKAISGKGEPANNTLLFDGLSGKAWSFLVKPKES